MRGMFLDALEVSEKVPMAKVWLMRKGPSEAVVLSKVEHYLRAEERWETIATFKGGRYIGVNM